MNLKGTKAQAAVEFLTTYGWAILFLLILITFIFYSGYLDVNRYLQKQCLFSSNFQCSSYKFEQVNSTAMRLIFQAGNGFGFDVYFSNDSALLLAENIGRTGKVNYSGRCYPDLVKSGELATCIVNITDADVVPSIGKNLNLQLKLNYTNCKTAPNYAQTGNCSGGSVYELSGSIRTSLEQKINLTQWCGDGICNATILENYFTCPSDCPSYNCPNGVCEPAETYSNCPGDCCGSDCTNKTTDFTCHLVCSGAGGCTNFKPVCDGKPPNAKRCSDASGNAGNTHYVNSCCKGTITPCGTAHVCKQTDPTTATCVLSAQLLLDPSTNEAFIIDSTLTDNPSVASTEFTSAQYANINTSNNAYVTSTALDLITGTCSPTGSCSCMTSGQQGYACPGSTCTCSSLGCPCVNPSWTCAGSCQILAGTQPGTPCSAYPSPASACVTNCRYNGTATPTYWYCSASGGTCSCVACGPCTYKCSGTYYDTDSVPSTGCEDIGPSFLFTFQAYKFYVSSYWSEINKLTFCWEGNYSSEGGGYTSSNLLWYNATSGKWVSWQAISTSENTYCISFDSTTKNNVRDPFGYANFAVRGNQTKTGYTMTVSSDFAYLNISS